MQHALLYYWYRWSPTSAVDTSSFIPANNGTFSMQCSGRGERYFGCMRGPYAEFSHKGWLCQVPWWQIHLHRWERKLLCCAYPQKHTNLILQPQLLHLYAGVHVNGGPTTTNENLSADKLFQRDVRLQPIPSPLSPQAWEIVLGLKKHLLLGHLQGPEASDFD